MILNAINHTNKLYLKFSYYVDNRSVANQYKHWTLPDDSDDSGDSNSYITGCIHAIMSP